jgi:solute carrier family 25 (mitochondrial phosphate transporter), member 23/24/25/41
MKLTSEGDVQLSDDTIQGLGTLYKFLSPLLGTLITALVAICQTPQHQLRAEYSTINTHPAQIMSEGNFASQPAELASAFAPLALADWTQQKDQEVKPLLISLLPSPGYFAAGGLAGIISRTTTAPLDRLKVYLIAQVDSVPNPLHAVKSGAPLQAVRGAYMTSANAMKELWAAGGMRSLFAGK